MQGWNRATKEKRCPICDGPDNCTISDDGQFVYCGRISEGSTNKQNAGGQWLHNIGDSVCSNWLASNPRPRGLKNASPNTNSGTASRDWGRVSQAAFTSPGAASARNELARILGVSIQSLERLEIGYSGRVLGWTVPERNATGRVIGINRRRSNGDKRRDKGGQAGLTFDPLNWMDSDTDPDVFLVEGCSDTAAMLSIGLNAIGRPSNLGGVELLGELLKVVPADRRIAVIGENDRKQHSELPVARRERHKPDCQGCSACWPGWFGATKTAERLAEILDREVHWTLSPDGFKDVREWVNHIGFDSEKIAGTA